MLEAQKLEREKNGRCRLLEILPVPPVLYVYVYSIVRKKLPKLEDAELGRFDVDSSYYYASTQLLNSTPTYLLDRDRKVCVEKSTLLRRCIPEALAVETPGESLNEEGEKRNKPAHLLIKSLSFV